MLQDRNYVKKKKMLKLARVGLGVCTKERKKNLVTSQIQVKRKNTLHSQIKSEVIKVKEKFVWRTVQLRSVTKNKNIVTFFLTAPECNTRFLRKVSHQELIRDDRGRSTTRLYK